ncbi:MULTISPECIES: stalk domain-containing protein [unclassified Paenibacillus]|uniref:stalk domain-containing protein n=1 Tax=unclassified Paenibacillus TaxID=185978 RepID=UPI001AE4B5B4|nr:MULTISPECIES: stalk domain-containing protein [unclassified Paenibacillus]MBP1153651.1 hypothetical protein [Paenibacillus sp. PvP091]MBP1170964.1 hypothetical protein [Paenibacillus sp. PvR098]MBP2441992.1 hypothetical protein [Paenibacillus sp. PvP052]
MKRLFIVLVLVVFAIGCQSAPAVAADRTSQAVQPNEEYEPYQLEALAHLNRVRGVLGLQPVRLNPYITKAAENHANYIVINDTAADGLSTHDETPGNPGFTGESPTDRVRAAGGSQVVSEIINFTSNPAQAIESWMTTAYHRSPLTDPNADEFGIGIADGNVVLNMSAKTGNNEISVYPYDGQTDVGVTFYGASEIPNPLKQFHVEKSGFIISFQPPFHVDGIKATVTDGRGVKVPVYFEYAGAWFLYPVYPLAYDEQYTVSVDYDVNGATQNKTWSFRTMKSFVSIGSQHNIQIKFNGKFVPQSVTPILRDGTTFVPLRGIFERLNAKVFWNATSSTAIVTGKDTTMKLTIGRDVAYVNDKAVTISEAPFIRNGSTYVPLRFISETMGAKVQWDKERWTASIEADADVPDSLMISPEAAGSRETKVQTDANNEAATNRETKLNSIVNQTEGTLGKFGYSLYEVSTKDPDHLSAEYAIKDKTGKTFAKYVIRYGMSTPAGMNPEEFHDKMNNDQDYQMNAWVNSHFFALMSLEPLAVPQKNKELFSLLQAAMESASGMKMPNLADNLMQSFNDVSASGSNPDKKAKLHANVSYDISYSSNETKGVTTTTTGMVKVQLWYR